MMRRWIAVGAAGLVLAYAIGASATSSDTGPGQKRTKAEKSEDKERSKLQRSEGKDRERRGPKALKENRGRFGGLAPLLADSQARVAVADAIAKALGTTRDALAQSLREDDELEGAMKAKGVTEEQLGAVIAAALKPHLDRLVSERKIERASADELLAGLARGEALGKIVHIAVFGSR
jgi:hypothetical protein